MTGAVQSHGLLIALRLADFTILQISTNVFDILGIHHDELLHQPLSQMMDLRPIEEASHKIGERMPRLLNPIPITISARGRRKQFDGIMHRSGRILILELEPHTPADEGYGGFGGFYEAIREVATKILSADSLDQVLQIACEEVRKLTGFERVLAYKFDPEWNGAVVNESRAAGVPSFLLHHFPSTDIPKQARDLYTTNWLRIIPDVDYLPSPIMPLLNPITDRPLDLSNCVLRSVSPVHLEYMRHMGQAASMSVSILHHKRLWGLISCHNSVGRFLKYDTRVATEFIGQMVSAQVTAREEDEHINHNAQLRVLLAAALASAHGRAGALAILGTYGAQMLALADATGVAIICGDNVKVFGKAPAADDIARIRDAVAQMRDQLFFTDRIGGLIAASEDLHRVAAGVLAVSFSESESILWFRAEMTEHILWGGNPELSRNKDDGILQPRRSFATWTESVAGRSRAWRQPEIDAVASLFDALANMPPARGTVAPDQPNSGVFRTALAKSIVQSAETRVERENAREPASRPASIGEAASNSEALLEGFAEFAVLFLSPDGAIQNWTAGAQRLLGYYATQTIGRKIDMFLGIDEAAKGLDRQILEFVSEHNRCEEEIWLYRADKSSFWSKILVASIRDNHHALIGYSVVIQDVTKEKSAEEELRATKVAAEAANQAKSVFLANISHEIRTPLGAILGFAELLGSDEISEEERANLVERIERNGEQLTSIIDDLLDLTKVEANKVELELREFDLSALLMDINETLGIKSAERSVQLEFAVVGEVPKFIISDSTRLRQILVNIISNAIKFTPEGGRVTVDVGLDKRGAEPKILFHIEDTGRGMTQAQMAKLFQPFTQADASTTRKFGGTGLGLFLSQRLARLLDGDVSIERSAIGKGTVFLVQVAMGCPQAQATFAKLGHSVRPTRLNHLNNQELAGRHILIVDDSPDNRHLLRQYLTKAGATVGFAENGREAVDRALTEPYDLILMDIQMPILDGNAAMRELQKAHYEQPVIALTAHAMSEEREYSLGLGFSGYITKPISRDLLVRTIHGLTSASDSK